MDPALSQFSIIIESDADTVECKLYEVNGKRQPIRELIPERLHDDAASSFYKYKYWVSEEAHTIRMDISDKKKLEIRSIHFIWPNRIIRLETPQQISKFLDLKLNMILSNQNDKYQVEFSKQQGNYIFFNGQVNRYNYFDSGESNFFSNEFTLNIYGSRAIGFMVYFVSGATFHDSNLPYQYELMGKTNENFRFTQENYSKSISMISIEFPFIYSKDTVTLLKENLFSYNGIEIVDYSFIGCNILETDSSFKLTNASMPGLRPRIDVKLGVVGFEWYPLLFYAFILLLLVMFNRMLFMRKKSFFEIVQ
ncbi:hypothetical protein [Fulvivirga sp.]|uniref:hypothetical protein n=1 Tax=Fulvivirga sp. TaxID=1931237 RepID=UPI0032EE28FF